MEACDHAGAPLWERCWGWLAGVPGWAALLVAALAWCGVFALSWLVRTLLTLLLPASLGTPMWWGASLALTGVAAMLVARPRSLGDRLAGPVLYAVAFGLPGAGCYLVLRAAGQFNPSPVCRQAAAIAEWLPARAQELFARHAPPVGEPNPPQPSRRMVGLVLVACIVLAGALYRPILDAGIRVTAGREDIDFFLTIKEYGPWRWSKYISPWYFERGRYVDAEWTWFRPVQLLSYAMDYAVWGERLQGWHLTSVLLHVANVALVFWAVSLVTRDRLAGLAAGGIYAFLPSGAGAVCWIGARPSLLCGLFALGTIVCVTLLLMGGSKWLWPAVVVLFGLALSSKETSVSIGGVLAVWVAVAGPGPRKRRWAVAATLAGLVLGYAVWRLSIGSIHSPPRHVYPGWQGTRSLRWYGGMLWAPATQIASALQMRTLAFPGIHLAALVAALALLRRAWRPALLWLTWKGVLLVPLVGFAAMGAWRQYVPNVGAAALSGILVQQGMATTSKWPIPLRWAAIGVLLWFAVGYVRALPEAVGAWLQ